MMREWLQIVEGHVVALSMRERLLIFISGVALISVVWNLLFFTPQNVVRNSLKSQMLVVEQKLDAGTQEATVLAELTGVEINQVAVRQLSQFKSLSTTLDDKVAKISSGLVPADELLSLLKEVLEKSNVLTIQRVEFLAPETLSVSDGSNSSGSYAPIIFRHTLELTLHGSYFDLLGYLQELEKLPWRLYWDSLTYEVNEYPQGDIELRVSTLSISGVSFDKKSH